MYKVTAHIFNRDHADLIPLSGKRDWMDNLIYPYKCFPLSTVNKFGYGVCFKNDISFIWDGTVDPDNSGVTILSGEQHCYLGRNSGTVSFSTGIMFKTDENVSLYTFPVPNKIYEDVQCLSSLLSTSFFTGVSHVVWKINTPNKVITIKAGTPVAAIIPISVSEIQGSVIEFSNEKIEDLKLIHAGESYIKKMQESDDKTDFYKRATDENGLTIGKHEVKNINLFVKKEGID
jgi:hypothetical protein